MSELPPTGLVRATQIVVDATRQKHEKIKLFLSVMTPEEREEYLDRLDEVPDDKLAAPGERLCAFCFTRMQQPGCCESGCAGINIIMMKKSKKAAYEALVYYRNRLPRLRERGVIKCRQF